MPKANKSAKTAAKAAAAKAELKARWSCVPSRAARPRPQSTVGKALGQPVLNKPAVKPTALMPTPAAPDDVPVIALNLAPAKLSPAMAAYFKKCQDKLGFVPNVLAGLRLRHGEARNLRRHVQRPDAGRVRPVQARARDDRGRGVVAEPLLLLPDRARRRGPAIFRQSAARRAARDELSRRRG